MPRRSRAKLPCPFRCFSSSPEVTRLIVLMYVRFPLSLRNVEDLLFAGGIRHQRASRMRGSRHCRWHLDEMHVKLSGEIDQQIYRERCSAATAEWQVLAG